MTVGSVAELERALRVARPDTAILLKSGEYRLERPLDVSVEGLLLRSADGERDRVIIRGSGITERAVGVALAISAPRVTIADMTVGSSDFMRFRSVARPVHNVSLCTTCGSWMSGSSC